MRSEEEIRASMKRLKTIEIEEDFESAFFEGYKEALEWVLQEDNQ